MDRCPESGQPSRYDYSRERCAKCGQRLKVRGDGTLPVHRAGPPAQAPGALPVLRNLMSHLSEGEQ